MIDHAVYLDYRIDSPFPGEVIGEFIMPPIPGDACADRCVELLALGYELEVDILELLLEDEDDGCPVCSFHDREALFFVKGETPREIDIPLHFIQCHACGWVQMIVPVLSI